MIKTSVQIPVDSQPKVLTFTDIANREGIYRSLDRDYSHRFVTLKNAQGDKTTLYCSETVLQPVMDLYDEDKFLEVTDEKITALFAKL
jgi:hypothetical protein